MILLWNGSGWMVQDRCLGTGQSAWKQEGVMDAPTFVIQPHSGPARVKWLRSRELLY